MKKLNVFMVLAALTGLAHAEPAKVAPISGAPISAPVVKVAKGVQVTAARLPEGLTFRGGTLTVAEGLVLKQADGRLTVSGLFGKKKPKPKPEPDTIDFWCACFDGSQGSCSLSVQGQTATCGGDACCSMMTSPAAVSPDAPAP